MAGDVMGPVRTARLAVAQPAGDGPIGDPVGRREAVSSPGGPGAAAVQERSQLLHECFTNRCQLLAREIDMNRRQTWLGWLGALFALALLALAGVYLYDLGVARGLAEGGGAAPVLLWRRPWGFGFFPLFPFLILLWIALRGFFWRGPWSGRGWYGPRWYGRGRSDPRDGVPPAFEEWHRRAHDQQQPPAAGTKG
jgi:hypothetical protein